MTCNTIEKRFSAAAGLYNRHAGVQTAVALKVIKNAELATGARDILELGCGTGIFTRMLVKTFPVSRVTAVDISGAMIAQAKDSMGEAERIEWRVGDFSTMEFKGKFDLIAGSSSLHWILPHGDTFGRIRSLLASGGHLVFGMMVDGTLDELRRARHEAAPGKSQRRNMLTEHEVKDALVAAGFAIRREKRESVRIVFPSAINLLQQLHEQGVTGGMFGSERGALTRGELRRLIEWYDAEFKCRHGVFATYEVLHVVATGDK